MTLAEIVSITGLGGLFKIINRRNDGLIVTSLLDDKTQFVSGRTHLFSTLDNITMYTQEDTRELKLILAEIKKQEASNPVSAVKTDADVKAFFEKVMPDYDKEKIYISDMKKLVKWYQILDAKGLIPELTAENKATDSSKENENSEEVTEKKATKTKKVGSEEKPKKEPKPKSDNASKGASKTVAPPKRITTPRKAS